MPGQGKEGKDEIARWITDVITAVTKRPRKGARGLVAGNPGTK